MRIAELGCLRSLRFARGTIGDLAKIRRVRVFGPEHGAHARVNVGVASLPFNVAMAVTIEYELE